MDRTDIYRKFKSTQDNLIGILHELQDSNPKNYLSEEDMKETAKYLNTTYSHVYGVATYYTMFSVKPRGKYIIRVCNSPVCDMKESPRILDKLKALLRIEIGETTKDSLFTLELTECLGRCAVAPSMMVNKNIYGLVEIERLEGILGRYK